MIFIVIFHLSGLPKLEPTRKSIKKYVQESEEQDSTSNGKNELDLSSVKIEVGSDEEGMELENYAGSCMSFSSSLSNSNIISDFNDNDDDDGIQEISNPKSKSTPSSSFTHTKDDISEKITERQNLATSITIRSNKIGASSLHKQDESTSEINDETDSDNSMESEDESSNDTKYVDCKPKPMMNPPNKEVGELRKKRGRPRKFKIRSSSETRQDSSKSRKNKHIVKGSQPDSYFYGGIEFKKFPEGYQCVLCPKSSK